MAVKQKLSSDTNAILKNFAGINKSIYVKPGSTISTLSESKAVAAHATVTEEFETGFGIWELPRFLSTLSLFTDPELIISEKTITVIEGTRKLSYTCSPAKMILTLEDKQLNKLEEITGEAEVEFPLENSIFQATSKALSTLKLPEFRFFGDGEKIKIQAFDSGNETADFYENVLSESDVVFDVVFRAENLKFLPGDYRVSIAGGGVGKFATENLTYYVVAEAKK